MREATVAIAPRHFRRLSLSPRYVDDGYRQPASIFLIEMRAAYGAAILQRLARAAKDIFFFRTPTIERMYVPIDSAHDIFL